ncbi:unnamed protein product [Bemisia tabaci]|uniref:PID domain-containing protein n=1 Tax=Bemisia tabaci TaxID=7038 RepID=A0A9P0CE14_BEMTA|nr:unnamed protein product [Bemisia tabaci]
MMEVETKEDFRERTLRTVKRGLRKLCRRNSVTITEYDPSYKVTYLGNVLTGWAKGEACVDKPLSTLWRNYQTTSKPDTQMKITVTQSGLKAVTKEHGLTEYWSHRISFCTAPTTLPKVFCWVYRHEGRKLKPELRCHAVLCSKDSIARRMASELQRRLVQALIEFKRDKISRQNARLSLANSVYDNPSLPRRKILLSTGTHNYKPPLERSKSAPKLMAIEENLEEEEEPATKCDRLPFLRPTPQIKPCIRPDRHLKRHATEGRFGANKLGGLLQVTFKNIPVTRDKSPRSVKAVSDPGPARSRSDSDSESVSPDKNELSNGELDRIVNENVIKILSETSAKSTKEPAIERISEEDEGEGEVEEDATSETLTEVEENPFGADEHVTVPIPADELTDFDEGSVTDEGETEEDFEKRMKELNKWNRLLLTQRSNSITSDISLSSLEDCGSDAGCILERPDMFSTEDSSNYASETEWSEAPEESGLESIGSDISCTMTQRVLGPLREEEPIVDKPSSVEKDPSETEMSHVYEARNESDMPPQFETSPPTYQTNELIDYRTATSLEENPPSYEEAVQQSITGAPTKFNSLVRDRKRMFERETQNGDCGKQGGGSQRDGEIKRSFFINNRRKIFEQVETGEFKGFAGLGNLKRKMSEESAKGEDKKLDTYPDEDSTPSLQSISSGSDSSVLKSGEANMNGYDLHSISSSEDSDESGFVESLTADDPLNKNDDKSRDLPHHQLMKSCILTSKTRCVEV